MTGHPNSSSARPEDPAEEFRAELPDFARRLREAFADRNEASLRSLAHRLVGSAGLLGLGQISGPAAALHARLNRVIPSASIKGDVGLAESVEELTLACERAAGAIAPRP
ncbi:MAG: Hpt domain-containing protein [Phycisphaerales bacterium]|nr:Hpt domain-containing protein [Phycisphaerales bacterium]